MKIYVEWPIAKIERPTRRCDDAAELIQRRVDAYAYGPMSDEEKWLEGKP